MAGTFDGPSHVPAVLRSTWGERAIVLSAGAGAIGPLWMAAVAWTVPSSLALALRRGIRCGDWSAFRSYELPDGRDERIDWVSKTGQYAYMRIAEEHERMMRGD